MTKLKFFSQHFWAGIDSECLLKRYSKLKISKSKFFSRVKFFLALSQFLAKMAKIVKNDKFKSYWPKKILVGINSKSFKT